MHTKICSKCKELKQIDQFRKDSSRKSGVTSQCKSCASESYKIGYNKSYKDKASVRTKIRYAENMRLIKEYIGQNASCAFCDESEYCCLDFHHIDPTTKKFGIGGSPSRSWKAIKNEIDKCILVCANCHRKIHNGIISLLK